jgi:signal transduction histidine kinase
VSAESANDRAETARNTYIRSIWGVLPLSLVVVALLGSLAIPARQTWLIMKLLRETTQVLAPSRLLVEQLQTNVSREVSYLQRYALSGDPAWLSHYRATAADDERRLVVLERLASRFDTTVASHTRSLHAQIGAWHRLHDASIKSGEFLAQLAAALETEDTPADSLMRTIGSLSLELATEGAARDGRLRSLEHLSIVSNAALVLAALVAVGGVGVLTLHERRLTETLRHRVSEESALREAAAALAGADTVDDVRKRIAHAALSALAGQGAFLQEIERGSGESPNVVVRAIAGHGVPPVGTTCPLISSYTDVATTRGEAMLLSGPRNASEFCPSDAMLAAGASAIVVPLGGDETPLGALFIVSSAVDPFHVDDVERARIFGHLAALAYVRVRLLEDAHAQRRSLEKLIQSRSRLMRGFSHDVKNPIGAADGFAELLSLGVYGELSSPQRVSVDRVRRNIHRALTLIDDLHELSRAETGNLAFAWEPVNLRILVEAFCEEYHAVAQARGLSLAIEHEGVDPIVETDQSRVRQIAANLLSNAIKYTERGSITLRAMYRSMGCPDESRSWAVLEVADSGIGVPADKREYIFEEFSRLNASDRAGAGLGLAISKLLAEGLGGHISVASEAGHGSTFALWLPACAAQ